MANALHSNEYSPFNKHQDSIMSSLARRLEIARKSNDLQLIQLLEREKQQVAPTGVAHNGKPQNRESTEAVNWFKNLRANMDRVLFGGTELQVAQFVDSSNDQWWYAFDPRTGNCVYADSEAELRLWIKQNYEGR